MSINYFLQDVFLLLTLQVFFTCQIVLKGNENVFEHVENWPKYQNFGEISGVGTDNFDNVYVFHRGDRQWNNYTFSNSNLFLGKNNGPITSETIVIIDSNSGSLVTKTGNNFFYLPHGLTVDHENNIWTTDVALHQVFKFPPLNFTSQNSTILEKPLLTLGKPFEPGSDMMHFCKPTGVAIDKETKDFYVSDGYCNSRIIKFNQDGKVLLVWGRTLIGSPYNNFYMLNIPHAVSLAQKEKILYVADRENYRVLSYNSSTGTFVKIFAEELSARIFSVAFSNTNNSKTKSGLLFVLSNNNSFTKTVSVYNVENGKLLSNLSPNNYFTNPHDIAVSINGEYCYVVELYPHKIWKFKIDFAFEIDHDEFNIVNSSQKAVTKEPVFLNNEINNSANFKGSNTYVTVGLIALSVIIFPILIFYYNKRKERRKHELRNLILHDGNDDD